MAAAETATSVPRTPRANALNLAGVVMLVAVAVGAALRFAGLDSQSYWLDESVTLRLLHDSFRHMLSGVHASESTPPLYYVLAWVWVRIFGYGEVGLRSMSALVGTLTIPVAYLAAKSLAGRRAGAIAAVLTALAPPLIWYSQEARSYALMTLMCGVSLVFFLRAWDRRATGDIALWAVSSALALCTHYFSGLPAGAEAVALLWRLRDRRVVIGCAVVAATGLALIPLALSQESHGYADWISREPLSTRLANTGRFFLTGLRSGSGERGWTIPALAVVAVASWLLLRASKADRRRVLVVAALGIAIVVLSIGAGQAGKDYVYYRNLLPAWLPLALAFACAVAVGWSGGAHRTIGILAVLGLAVLFVRYDIVIRNTPSRQRDDWRAVADRLGPARSDRVVVVSPGWQEDPLALYAPGLIRMSQDKAVREIDVVAYTAHTTGGEKIRIPTPGDGFEQIGRWRIQHMTLTRYRAARATAVSPQDWTGPSSDPGLISPFLQSPT